MAIETYSYIHGTNILLNDTDFHSWWFLNFGVIDFRYSTNHDYILTWSNRGKGNGRNWN